MKTPTYLFLGGGGVQYNPQEYPKVKWQGSLILIFRNTGELLTLQCIFFHVNLLIIIVNSIWGVGGVGRKSTVGTVIAQFLSVVFDSHCLRPELKKKKGQPMISLSALYMALTYL